MKPSDELISKKDLLTATGISYGQLYRWKRQNLIPEAWFIKQSSFTGQETFFPKKKVLERIEKIIGLKDSHSLEELSALLNPEATASTYKLKTTAQYLNISEAFQREYVCTELKREQIGFAELLLIYFIRKYRDQLTIQEWKSVQETFATWLPKPQLATFHIHMYRSGATIHTFAVQGGAELRVDGRWRPALIVSMEHLTAELQDKLLTMEDQI